MKHLDFEEIIDFISINDLSEESLALAAQVNSHLLNCAECRKKVDAYQLVFDEIMSERSEPTQADLKPLFSEDICAENKKTDTMLDGAKKINVIGGEEMVSHSNVMKKAMKDKNK